mmetsp:Transcript_32536/g.70874  ORF Transcript_32536/g.70874 Transcript_32536/m.70874 type:complete len:355 (-) Transcript_32536:275-1339(-)
MGQLARLRAHAVGQGSEGLLLPQPAPVPEAVPRGPRVAHRLRAGDPSLLPRYLRLRLRRRHGSPPVPGRHEVQGDLLLSLRRRRRGPSRAGAGPRAGPCASDPVPAGEEDQDSIGVPPLHRHHRLRLDQREQLPRPGGWQSRACPRRQLRRLRLLLRPRAVEGIPGGADPVAIGSGARFPGWRRAVHAPPLHQRLPARAPLARARGTWRHRAGQAEHQDRAHEVLRHDRLRRPRRDALLAEDEVQRGGRRLCHREQRRREAGLRHGGRVLAARRHEVRGKLRHERRGLDRRQPRRRLDPPLQARAEGRVLRRLRQPDRRREESRRLLRPHPRQVPRQRGPRPGGPRAGPAGEAS